jgi:hypothetical protein
VEIRVGQQGEEAGALDRVRQLPLVAGRGPGDARRDDLAVLVDEVLEDLDVLVVDPLDLLGGEAAELAAAEQRPLALVLLVLSVAGASETPSMNSMFVTCRISLFERLPFAARKPCSFIALPSGLAASSFAWASNATALTSARTSRFAPASSWLDSCSSLKSIAARPAGV